MNANATLFKPTDVLVTLAEKEYRIVFDLNAFCEIEKMYESVDSVLQMLLGVNELPDMEAITYKGEKAIAEDILIAGIPLASYVAKVNNKKEAKHSDTLNLLWVGLLHDSAVYNEHDEIISYSLSKSKVGSMVTFKNLRLINMQIITAILRDLIPPNAETKNEEAPVLTLAPKTEA